jgi:hypothetical protein
MELFLVEKVDNDLSNIKGMMFNIKNDKGGKNFHSVLKEKQNNF